jgi:DNA-binding IclR family transcriptional regulator
MEDESGTPLKDIVDSVELSKSAVYNHLATLVDEGYVIKEDNCYRLSLRLLELGTGIQRRSELYQEGKHRIRQLAQEVSEQVNLVVEENGLGVVLYQAETEDTISSGLNPGSPFPLHSTATGRAILAFLNDETVERIFDERGLEQLTEYTITERQRLQTEFETIREEHFVRSKRGRVRGVNSIAVPLLSAVDDYERYDYADDDHVIRAAIGIPLNNNEYRKEDRIAELRDALDKYKDDMSVNLSYS